MLPAFWNWLVGPAGLSAHGFCLLWEPWLIGLHAASDAAIGVAYLTIPVALLVHARRRSDLLPRPVLMLFVAFILLCGVGHFLELLTLWVPVYRLAGVEKVATAIVSLTTALALWQLIPRAMTLPSREQMETVTEALRASQATAAEAMHAMGQLRGVVEASPTALVLADREGDIRMVNARAEAMFGYDRDALQKQKLESLLPPPFRDRHAQLRAEFHRNVAARIMGEGRTLFGLRRDGETFPIEIGLSPLELDGETMVLAGVSDITARRAAEREMRQRQEALEHSNAELIRARLRAEQASRAKSRFLAGMSHELRTPLNSILGYAELLQVSGGLQPEQAARVEAMQQAGRHLLGMITNVLDLSVIEAGRVKLNVTAVDPRVIAEDCIGLVRPTAEARGLALSLSFGPEIPDRITADPTRVRQILLNLLANAVKFTDRGSVALRLFAVRSGSDAANLCFAVQDTGRGVAAERRADLFQDFDRLDIDPDGAIEGAGLGLAISRRLADAMGGCITHANNPGGGSVFTFSLPCEVASLPSRPAPEPPRAPLPPARTILVVDDIAMNRDITGSFLQHAGHAVVFAEGGAQAVAAAGAQDFDLVLMDLRMPEIDGFEATRRIRALGGARSRVPILALTAQAFSEQIDECWRAGMVGHLAKPFTQAALLQAVAEAVGDGKTVADRHEPAAMPDFDALPVLKLDTYETSAAFLSPEAVVRYLEDIVQAAEAVQRNFTAEPGNDLSEAHLHNVHALIGKVGMLGFIRLTSVARHFERVARSGAEMSAELNQALKTCLEASLLETRFRLAAAHTAMSAAHGNGSAKMAAS